MDVTFSIAVSHGLQRDIRPRQIGLQRLGPYIGSGSIA